MQTESDTESKTRLTQEQAQTDTELKRDIVQEIGGIDGLEPTRFGDWEKNGRCIDF